MLNPYPFSPDTLPVDINTTYKFRTKNGHLYAITFIEATRIVDILDNYPVISNAIYLTIEVVEVNGGVVLFDPECGITITKIIEHYLGAVGMNTIIIFNCDAADGKQYQRHLKFDRWYKHHGKSLNFEKVDQEILEPSNDATYTSSFLSILFSQTHPRRDTIFEELIKLKAEIGTDKLN